MARGGYQLLSAVLSWAVITLVSVKAIGIIGDKRLPRSKHEAQQAMELGSKGLRSLNHANLVNERVSLPPRPVDAIIKTRDVRCEN